MTRDVSRRAVLRTAGAVSTGALALTGAGPAAASTDADGATDADGGTADCDDPAYPSIAWSRRERANYAKTREAPAEQARDPAFQGRWRERSALNAVEFRRRTAAEPGWNSEGNVCKEWSEQCTGDPFRYPASATYEGDDFYADVGERTRVAFHDSGLDVDEGGARLSGRVWVPRDSAPGDDLPGVVITNGSVQAPETLYWWFAQTLVEAGYVVLTYDPRGQGRSDSATPGGTPGSNAHDSVFVTNQVDAIDFLRSTPDDPYPHNTEDPEAVPAPVRAHNPYHDRLDRSRLGVVGHSLGARGVSVVQGIADDDWPGALDDANPVDVAVAWDNLAAAGTELAGYEVRPRVPAMGQSADYGLTPTPKTRPPDPEGNNAGYAAWVEAGVDAFQVTVRGGTHYEWSLLPTFPTTSWEFGNPMADHYSLAWLDYYLQGPGAGAPGESGTPAVQRLLADDDWRDRMSFYYRSARDFDGHRDPDVTGCFSGGD